jgi:hypothetical protein
MAMDGRKSARWEVSSAILTSELWQIKIWVMISMIHLDIPCDVDACFSPVDILQIVIILVLRPSGALASAGVMSQTPNCNHSKPTMFCGRQ